MKDFLKFSVLIQLITLFGYGFGELVFYFLDVKSAPWSILFLMMGFVFACTIFGKFLEWLFN